MSNYLEIVTLEIVRDSLKLSLDRLASFDSYEKSEMGKLQPEQLSKFLLEIILGLQNLPALFETLGIIHKFNDESILNENDLPIIVLKFPGENIRHFHKVVANKQQNIREEIRTYLEEAAKLLFEQSNLVRNSS